MPVHVRVIPASSRTEVGGRYGASDPPTLVVRVTAPAVDGRANVAAVEALADAFAVKEILVTLTAAHSSRNKVFETIGGDRAVLADLLAR
jgi:uncharacterized protein